MNLHCRVGLFIKSARMRAELTIPKAAKKLEVPEDWLTQAENGEVGVPLHLLAQMIEIYNINRDSFNDFQVVIAKISKHIH